MPLHHVPLAAEAMKSRHIFRLAVRTSLVHFVHARSKAAAELCPQAGAWAATLVAPAMGASRREPQGLLSLFRR